jgi:hypothetical protein
MLSERSEVVAMAAAKRLLCIEPALPHPACLNYSNVQRVVQFPPSGRWPKKVAA